LTNSAALIKCPSHLLLQQKLRIRRIQARAFSTPAKPEEPVLAKVKLLSSELFWFFLINMLIFQLQVYGGLKDQDRIFTNLYGEGVCYPVRP
jgi:hypothetical protein